LGEREGGIFWLCKTEGFEINHWKGVPIWRSVLSKDGILKSKEDNGDGVQVAPGEALTSMPCGVDSPHIWTGKVIVAKWPNRSNEEDRN